MHIKPYKLKTDTHKLRYELISSGVNNQQQSKIIEFQEFKLNELEDLSAHKYFHGCDSIFNLAFGDTEDGEVFSDDTVTNNGDMLIVLRTVALAVENFLLEHPNSVIPFRGSSKSRTRLYRMHLNKFYEEISSQFMIFSAYNGEIRGFESGVNAQAFFIKNHSNRSAK